MFTYCVKLLVMGMMGLHSLLGCHVHHLSAACCPVPQLERSAGHGEQEAEQQARLGPAGCGSCCQRPEAPLAAAPTDSLSSAGEHFSESSEPLPGDTCCSESRCVFLSEVVKAQLVATVSLPPESTLVELHLRGSEADLEAWKTRCFRQWRPPTAPAWCAIRQCWLL